MVLSSTQIEANYDKVREEIVRATGIAGRNFEDVKLVVISKGHSIDVVRNALDAGIRCLGENYVEEAKQKIDAIQDESFVEWHMIGHIQSRKARMVCELFDYVHSLDSVKLAGRLNRFAAEIGHRLPILLECNVSGELSKFGWKAWEEERWEELLPEFTPIASMPNLEIRGLMTMAPFLRDVEGTRPYFRRLRDLGEYLVKHMEYVNWQELSMGMSADYQVAIQEGASIVRIGTAVLGARS
jgi:pyridoxal phosphate enzyme (YggS family)